MREIPSLFSDTRARNREIVDLDFQRVDPWSYDTSEMELARLDHQMAVLRRARPDGYGDTLEIGCAEGAFTRHLARLCRHVTAVDLSSVALQRAIDRCSAFSNIAFRLWDLRRDAPLGQYDLVVITGVLDYFSNPRVIAAAVKKIVASMTSGAYLLVESTRPNEVIEQSFWGKRLLRGRWINDFVARNEPLEVVEWPKGSWYELTLYRKPMPAVGTV